VASDRVFGFVQFEFGYLLGPADGRYVRRQAPDSEPATVVVLRTLGAPERRRLRGRRARRVTGGGPEPVPTARATLVRAEPFDSEEGAAEWLHRLRGDAAALSDHVAAAARELNAVLRAHRAAAADPHARDVSPHHALVVRVGYGGGEQLAEGRFSEAYELPRRAPGRRAARERLAPDERFVAILGAREEALAGEELLLRARADLDAGRTREGALQARIALETLSAELEPGRARDEVERHRSAVGKAANAALEGEPPEPLRAAVEEAVKGMESALARRSY
jgi:hypothetical protein